MLLAILSLLVLDYVYCAVTCVCCRFVRCVCCWFLLLAWGLLLLWVVNSVGSCISFGLI